MRVRSLAVVAVAALMAIGGSTGHSSAGYPPDRSGAGVVHVVRVLCEFSGRTTINVYNPGGRAARLSVKGIPLEAGMVPTPPGEPHPQSLNPGWALLMDCDDIVALGAVGPRGSGDLIIGSWHELEVWATYTSIVAGGGIGETRVLDIPAIKIGR